MARIRHIAILTKDTAKLAEFYRTSFGFKEVARSGDDGEAIFVVDDRKPVSHRIRHALERREESEVNAALRHRGDGFVDVHLNATTRWRDVPVPIWSYTLGGYQVLKKWLSYREAILLGRRLTAAETLDFTKHVRRLAALLKLHPQLDAHYAAVTQSTFNPH